MRATGIVRRVDELGRVVIPREIRNSLRIREGDALEIFTDKDGQIIFQKYSPLGVLGSEAQIITKTLGQRFGCPAFVATETEVLTYFNGRRESQEMCGAEITQSFYKAVRDGQVNACILTGDAILDILDGRQDAGIAFQVIVPIGDGTANLGAIVMQSQHNQSQERVEEMLIALQISASILFAHAGDC